MYPSNTLFYILKPDPLLIPNVWYLYPGVVALACGTDKEMEDSLSKSLRMV